MNYHSRCPECPGRNPKCFPLPNVIPGHGPIPCRVAAIGEAGAKHENFRRLPFVGPSGQEIDNTYFPLAGVWREDVYVTNTVKCMLLNERKPSDKLIDSCSRHFLLHELREVQPEIIILMGAIACKLIGGVDLERDHGILRKAELFGEEYWFYPVFHPAAGLRGMTLGDGAAPVMHLLLEDFAKLKPIIGDLDNVEQYQFKENQIDTQVRLLSSVREVERAFEGCWFDPKYESRVMGVDTEQVNKKLWSAQSSLKPGQAFVAKANTSASRELKYALNRYTFLLHSSGQDLRALSQEGIVPHRFIDTQVIAYRLQNQPQGLKALAYRLCGMRMQSYPDLITQWVRPRMIEWLLTVYEGLKDVETEYITPKKRLRKVKYVKDPLESIIRHLLRYGMANDEYDLWGKWEEIQQDEIQQDETQEDYTNESGDGDGVDCVGIGDGGGDYGGAVLPGTVDCGLDSGSYTGGVDEEVVEEVDGGEGMANGESRGKGKRKGSGKGKRLHLTPEMVERALELGGEMPLPDISWVPEDKAVEYGGIDADAELRVGLKLMEMAGRELVEVVEGDWDQ